MLYWVLLVAVSGCGDVISAEVDENTTSTDEALKAPRALNASDFRGSVNKASIRATQPWLDNGAFDVKWAAMLKAPIEFFGGSDAFFHSDLGTVPAPRIPGGEGLCHGDPKFDNFGWNLVDGRGNFSDNDFDDAGYCPVAVDVLRYLVATDLWFNDAALNAAALNAYIKTLASDSNAVGCGSSAAM